MCLFGWMIIEDFGSVLCRNILQLPPLVCVWVCVYVWVGVRACAQVHVCVHASVYVCVCMSACMCHNNNWDLRASTF